MSDCQIVGQDVQPYGQFGGSCPFTAGTDSQNNLPQLLLARPQSQVSNCSANLPGEFGWLPALIGVVLYSIGVLLYSIGVLLASIGVLLASIGVLLASIGVLLYSIGVLLSSIGVLLYS
ncbi:MAG: hypothetical protein ACK6D4_13690, partial [Planctomyces sp.]